MARKIEKFEDLEVWKESMSLSVDIYQLLMNCKDFSFKDQIQRSSISIPSNIAEGYDRQSNKEFIHYLYIARGSCAEVRTHLYLAKEFNYIDEKNFKNLLDSTQKISAMLFNLIKARRRNFV